MSHNHINFVVTFQKQQEPAKEMPEELEIKTFKQAKKSTVALPPRKNLITINQQLNCTAVLSQYRAVQSPTMIGKKIVNLSRVQTARSNKHKNHSLLSDTQHVKAESCDIQKQIPKKSFSDITNIIEQRTDFQFKQVRKFVKLPQSQQKAMSLLKQDFFLPPAVDLGSNNLTENITAFDLVKDDAQSAEKLKLDIQLLGSHDFENFNFHEFQPPSSTQTTFTSTRTSITSQVSRKFSVLQSNANLCKKPTQIHNFANKLVDIREEDDDSTSTSVAQISKVSFTPLEKSTMSLRQNTNTHIMTQNTLQNLFNYNPHEQYLRNKQQKIAQNRDSVSQNQFKAPETVSVQSLDNIQLLYVHEMNNYQMKQFPILETIINVVQSKATQHDVCDMGLLAMDFEILEKAQYQPELLVMNHIDLIFLPQRLNESFEERQLFVNHIVQNINYLYFILSQKITQFSFSVILQQLYQRTDLCQLSLLKQDFDELSLQLLNSFLVATQISILEFDQCVLNSNRIQHIQQGILNQNNLLLFNISNNALQDEGCIMVLNAIAQKSDHLKFLGMSNCQSADGTVQEFCELSNNYFKSLSHIDMSNNPNITRISYQTLVDYVKRSVIILQFNLFNACYTARQIAFITSIMQRNYIAIATYQDIVDFAADFQAKKSDPQFFGNRLFFLNYDELFSKMRDDIVYSEFKHQLTKTLINRAPESDFYLNVSFATAETMGRRDEMEDVQLQIADFYTYRSRRLTFRQMNLAAFQQKTKHVRKEMLFCLFDGHGGRDCSEALSQLLPAVLADTINHICHITGFKAAYEFDNAVWEWLFNSVFLMVNTQLCESGVTGGSTAIIILIVNDLIISANCGDSRALLIRRRQLMKQCVTKKFPAQIVASEVEQRLSKVVLPKLVQEQQLEQIVLESRLQRANTAVIKQINSDHYALKNLSDFKKVAPSSQQFERLTRDHKPEQPDELARIVAAHAYVENGRILNYLAVSRAFGDFDFQPAVVCMPHVALYKATTLDSAVVFCCDGVFDVLSDDDVSQLVLSSINPQQAAIKIRDFAYKGKSADNISVCVITLGIRAQEVLLGKGV